MISDQMDFNDHAYRRFVEKIKVSDLDILTSKINSRLMIAQDSLDPNGILSPGKQGIWPQKYRHLRDNAANGHRKEDGNGQPPELVNGHAINGANGSTEVGVSGDEA